MNKISVKVKVTKNPKLENLFKEAHELSLQSMGLFFQDAVARNTHVVTGVLKNSWNSQTTNWDSGFGDYGTSDAKIVLTEKEKIGKPADPNRLKTGGNLKYTKPYNDKFAVLEITLDQNNHRLSAVASAAYKKVIGT